jgi:hypothetical protein
VEVDMDMAEEVEGMVEDMGQGKKMKYKFKFNLIFLNFIQVNTLIPTSFWLHWDLVFFFLI